MTLVRHQLLCLLPEGQQCALKTSGHRGMMHGLTTPHPPTWPFITLLQLSRREKTKELDSNRRLKPESSFHQTPSIKVLLLFIILLPSSSEKAVCTTLRPYHIDHNVRRIIYYRTTTCPLHGHTVRLHTLLYSRSVHFTFLMWVIMYDNVRKLAQYCIIFGRHARFLYIGMQSFCTLCSWAMYAKSVSDARFFTHKCMILYTLLTVTVHNDTLFMYINQILCTILQFAMCHFYIFITSRLTLCNVRFSYIVLYVTQHRHCSIFAHIIQANHVHCNVCIVIHSICHSLAH